MNTFIKNITRKYDIPSILYITGATTSGIGGGTYAGYKTMHEFKNHDLVETTVYTSFAVIYGGCLGVVGWAVSPLVITVAGAVYLNKKYNEK